MASYDRSCCWVVEHKQQTINPLNMLKTGNLQMGTLVKNEYPDEVPLNVAYHRGLHSHRAS